MIPGKIVELGQEFYYYDKGFGNNIPSSILKCAVTEITNIITRNFDPIEGNEVIKESVTYNIITWGKNETKEKVLKFERANSHVITNTDMLFLTLEDIKEFLINTLYK